MEVIWLHAEKLIDYLAQTTLEDTGRMMDEIAQLALDDDLEGLACYPFVSIVDPDEE